MILGAWQLPTNASDTGGSITGMGGMSGMAASDMDMMQRMLASQSATPTGMSMPMSSTSASRAASGGMNMDYNYFTINGKAYPATQAWTIQQGDLVRVRIANISNLVHPMHLHGQDFKIIAKDGEPR